MRNMGATLSRNYLTVTEGSPERTPAASISSARRIAS